MPDRFKLFPYQEEGAGWLQTKKHALLADEMGLGKTVQSIVAADRIKAKRILVICPAIARYNWLSELNRFASTPRDYALILKQKKKWPKDKSIIVSYEGASAVSDSGSFDLIIVDEAHYLKSKDAKRTKRILGGKGLVHQAKYFWALSGTPAPNHPGELWPLMYTLGWTDLKYTPFIERYCESFKGPYGLQIKGANLLAIDDLKEKLKPNMLRRKKEDVMLELPPIHYSNQLIEPEDVNLREYQSFFKYTQSETRMQELAQKLEEEQRLVDAALAVHDNIYSTLATLESMAQSISTLRRFTGIQKIKSTANMIAQELRDNAYNKIVIFAVHRDVIVGLQERLNKEFKALTLYGGHSPSVKEKNLKKFWDKKNHRVLICNIQTAGTAINLTCANQVVFVEQDWVPGNNAQAAMRCHRVGQEHPVFVRFFGIADSLDERISRALLRKTRDLTKIFDSE